MRDFAGSQSPPPLPPPLPPPQTPASLSVLLPQAAEQAAVVPGNAFANDGNFMAQFLASQQQHASASDTKKPDSVEDVVVIAAEQDDHVQQSVASNDGSFMATFLALQHKEERRAKQQQREKEEEEQKQHLPVSSSHAKKTSASSSTKPVHDHQATTKKRAPLTSATATTENSPRKKRSRWDAASTAESSGSAHETEDGAGGDGHEAKALLVDAGLDEASEATIRAKQQKHLQELRFLEQRIRGFHQQTQLADASARSKAQANAMLSEERRQEYERLALLLEEEKAYKDSLEDAELGTIQDGTLEHRRRAREMLETLQSADALTTHAEGKHHLGDFLPQAELDKFMEEAKALADSRAGRDDTPLLDQQAEGRWTNSNGDTPPSSRANTAAQRDVAHSAASRGIGHESSEHLQQDDDEFDQYRKRMMLAYRFRPNPLD